jgi:hypothetical protein
VFSRISPHNKKPPQQHGSRNWFMSGGPASVHIERDLANALFGMVVYKLTIYIYIYIYIRGRRRVSMRNRLWTYSNQLLTKKRYPGMEVVLIAWSYLSCHAGSGFIVNLPKTHHNGINEGVWYNIPMIGSTPGCTSLAACDITKL